MDKKESFENKIELKDTAPDMSKMTHLPGGHDYHTGETTRFEKKENASWWENSCQHGKKPDWRGVLSFIGNIQEGIYQDVKYGKRSGETRPEEFWARVWTQMHQSGGDSPQNLPNEVLREKWTDLKKAGRSTDEIWDTMERQYPLAFLLVPLLQRWHDIGRGEPVENVRMWDGLDTYNTIMFYILKDKNPELKDTYEGMKQQGMEEEFWKENWDYIHGTDNLKAICEDKSKSKGKKNKNDFEWEKWILQQKKTNSFGDEVHMAPEYHKCYPLGYDIYRRIRRLIRHPDGRPIYKQFNFFS